MVMRNLQDQGSGGRKDRHLGSHYCISALSRTQLSHSVSQHQMSMLQVKLQSAL